MSSDYDALMQAIIDNPDEDTPRLMLADWLEENDDPERALFIRAQIAYANQQPFAFPTSDGENVTYPWQEVRMRAWGLLSRHGEAWGIPGLEFWGQNSDREAYTRGFMSRLQVPVDDHMAEFIERYSALAPIQRLNFLKPSGHRYEDMHLYAARLEKFFREDAPKLKVWKGLTALFCQDLDMGNAAAEALAACMPPKLQVLWLAHNQIDDSGMCALVGGLPDSLTNLNVTHNDFGDEGAIALAARMPLHMRQLRLSENMIHERGAQALANAHAQDLESIFFTARTIGDPLPVLNELEDALRNARQQQAANPRLPVTLPALKEINMIPLDRMNIMSAGQVREAQATLRKPRGDVNVNTVQVPGVNPEGHNV